MYREVDQTAKINMVFFYCTLHWAVPGYQGNRGSDENHAFPSVEKSGSSSRLFLLSSLVTHWEGDGSRDQRPQRIPVRSPFSNFFFFFYHLTFLRHLSPPELGNCVGFAMDEGGRVWTSLQGKMSSAWAEMCVQE